MGIKAQLSQIPSEILSKVKEKGAYEPNRETVGDYDWANFHGVYLDRTWSDFHEFFKEMGRPFQYALEGDYGMPEGIEGLLSGKIPSYLGYTSSSVSSEISAGFKSSHDDVESRLRKFLFARGLTKEYYSYFLPYFIDLVAFYQRVAMHHDAVFISIF